ncbi:SbcC-like subunit of palindrome specific endonuclease [Vibrio phage EniLVp02]
MLIFEKIKYKNIMSVGNEPVEFTLSEHSKTLITGTNGTGKSTFLEALCFALYGKPFRNKLNKPMLVNTVNGRQLSVELTFRDQRHQYKIIRGIKPDVFIIEQDGDPISNTAANGDFQQYLETVILKMNIATFKQIVVLGTAGFTPFMMLPAARRREIIEELLDIRIFSTMTEINKIETKKLQEELNTVEGQLRQLLSEVKIHTAYEEQRKTKNADTLKQYTKQLAESVRQFKEAGERVDELTAEQNELVNRVIESVDEDLRKIQSQVAQFTAEVNQAKKLRKFVESHSTCSTCHQEIGDEHRESVIKTTEAQVAEIAKQAQEAKAKREELQKINQERQELQNKIQNVRSQLQSVATQRDIHRRNAETIKDNIMAVKSEQEQGSKQAEIDSLKGKIRYREGNRKRLSGDKYCRDLISTILKDSGVKRLIIRKYIPAINQLINQYLQQLGANYNFTLDDEFNEKIKSRGRETFSYFSFSQGERCRIDLALLFAFRDLVAMKTGSMSNLLVMDEIYDSAADSEGVDDMNKILSTLKDNVIIISHSDKHRGFDRHLKMRKLGNFTKMTEEVPID